MRLVIFLLLLLVSTYSHGSEVALDYVMGEGDIKGLRLGYRPLHYSLAKYGFEEGTYVHFELSTNY